MTPQLNYQPKDTSYGERIVRLETRDETQEDKLDDLGEKIDKLVDVVHELKNGQDVVLTQFSGFQVLCEERMTIANEIVADYKSSMKFMNERFTIIDKELERQADDIDKSRWVVNWANDFRDNLPKRLLTGAVKFFMLPLVILAVFLDRAHYIDMNVLFKWFR